MEVNFIIRPCIKGSKFSFLPFENHIDWFPIWYNKKILSNMDIKVKISNYLNFELRKMSGIVCLDCRIFPSIFYNIYKYNNINYQKILHKFLIKLKKYAKHTLWFDNRDSSGTTQFNVIPYVDLYLKKQLLDDFSQYNHQFYLDRIYTDYYKRKLDQDYYTKKKPQNINFNNVKLSWNMALWDYRYLHCNKLKRAITKRLKMEYLNYYDVEKERDLLFSANFSTNYKSKFLSIQREILLYKLKKLLGKFQNASLGKVSQKKYMENLKNSRAIFSPFGLGEICRRDFETIISGATLIKPRMNHLRTWPDIYHENFTYIPLSWDYDKWEDEIYKIIENEKLLKNIGKNSQIVYKYYNSMKGRFEFCRRFQEILNLL